MPKLNFTQIRNPIIFLVSILLFPLVINAQEAEQEIVEAASGSSITVYVDAKFGKRTKGAAKSITKSHQKYEQQGYHFADLELYTENGDLEGFFVTYTKN